MNYSKMDFLVNIYKNSMNNEEIKKSKAEEINKKIIEYIKESQLAKETFEDNEVQVHIIVGEELNISDFQEPYFAKEQIIDLCNGIKILADNHETNKNAIVMEKIGKTKEGYRYRVYIMNKSKGLDMRKLLVKYGFPKTIGSHNNWNLDPKEYIDAPSTNFPDKKALIYTINKLVNGDEGLIANSEKEYAKRN